MGLSACSIISFHIRAVSSTDLTARISGGAALPPVELRPGKALQNAAQAAAQGLWARLALLLLTVEAQGLEAELLLYSHTLLWSSFKSHWQWEVDFRGCWAGSEEPTVSVLQSLLLV